MARSNPLGVDRWFESVGPGSDGDGGRVDADGDHHPPEAVTPALDLVELDGEFVVLVDLPGADRDDVDVRFEGQELTVVAERDPVLDVEDAEVVLSERSDAAAARTISFPEPVDPEGASATMEDGVLTVAIQKVVADSAVRHIDVA